MLSRGTQGCAFFSYQSEEIKIKFNSLRVGAEPTIVIFTVKLCAAAPLRPSFHFSHFLLCEYLIFKKNRRGISISSYRYRSPLLNQGRSIVVSK